MYSTYFAPTDSHSPLTHLRLSAAGQELRVLVGEPVEVDDLLAAAEQQGWAELRLQAAIADRVGQVG